VCVRVHVRVRVRARARVRVCVCVRVRVRVRVRVCVRVRVSLTNSLFLRTQEDVGSSEEEFMYEEDEEPDGDAVSEDDICLKLVRRRCPNTTKLNHYPSWAMISRIWKKICQTLRGLGTG